MPIFFTLVIKLIPFYIFILLGFLAGRILKVQKESIAPFLIYIITPLIVFHGVYTTPISIGTLILPFLFLGISVLLCLIVYLFSGRHWKDSTRNILAFTAGNGNMGYFGLPAAISIFGETVTGLVVLCILGIVLYENSLGFFITARGHHTIKESLEKVLTLPSIYAFFLALIFNLSRFEFGQVYYDTVIIFRGAYTFLGMSLIGLGLSGIKEFKFDWKFNAVAFLVKFIAWPAIIMAVIIADSLLFKIFNSQIHQVMILMSMVPLAANTVAYATQLKAQPEKAAVAVLLSTLFALFYIPIITSLFLS